MDTRQLVISLPKSILIHSGSLGLTDSHAVLRELSAEGAYCFTVLPLSTGEVIELFVTQTDLLGTLQLAFTATVVRVENGVTANSLGIAVRFSEVNQSSGSALQLELLEREPGVSGAEVQAESEGPVVEGVRFLST